MDLIHCRYLKPIIYVKSSIEFYKIRRSSYVKALILNQADRISLAIFKSIKYFKTIVLLNSKNTEHCLIGLCRKSHHKTLKDIKCNSILHSLKPLRRFQTFERFILNPYDTTSWKTMFYFNKLLEVTIQTSRQQRTSFDARIATAYLSRMGKTFHHLFTIKIIEVKWKFNPDFIKILKKIEHSLGNHPLFNGKIRLDVQDNSFDQFTNLIEPLSIYHKVIGLSLKSNSNLSMLSQLGSFSGYFDQLRSLIIEITDFGQIDMSALSYIQELDSVRKLSFAAKKQEVTSETLTSFFYHFSLPKKVEAIVLTLMFIDWNLLFPAFIMQDEDIFSYSEGIMRFFSHWKNLVNLHSLSIFMDISTVKYKALFAKNFCEPMLMNQKCLQYLALQFVDSYTQDKLLSSLNGEKQFNPYKERNILKLSELFALVQPSAQCLKKLTLSFPIISFNGLTYDIESKLHLEEVNLFGIVIDANEIEILKKVFVKQCGVTLSDLWISDEEVQKKAFSILSLYRRGAMSFLAPNFSSDDIIIELVNFIQKCRKQFQFSLEYHLTDISKTKLKILGDILREKETFAWVELVSKDILFIYNRHKNDYVICDPRIENETAQEMLNDEEGEDYESWTLQDITWIERNINNDIPNENNDNLFE